MNLSSAKVPGLSNSLLGRAASSGCLPPSPVLLPNSWSKARRLRFAAVRIPLAACFSTTTLARTAAAGALCRLAAIATKWLLFSAASPPAGVPSSPFAVSLLLCLFFCRDPVANPALDPSGLFHVFRLLSFSPRIVIVRKLHPLCDRRMAIEPEGNERRGIRIRQIFLAHHLE